jgi:hypothetical protein
MARADYRESQQRPKKAVAKKVALTSKGYFAHQANRSGRQVDYVPVTRSIALNERKWQ